MQVEKIIKKRIVKVLKYEYLVKWKNYEGVEYYTWELQEGLEGAEELIKNFDNDLQMKDRNMKRTKCDNTNLLKT